MCSGLCIFGFYTWINGFQKHVYRLCSIINLNDLAGYTFSSSMMKLFLLGHRFGGKVVLSMVEQAAKPLARPVRVWVLDATPGKVRPGGDGEDHPEELISFLSKMPNEVNFWSIVVFLFFFIQPRCGATTSTTEAFFWGPLASCSYFSC
ncbi:hypothetical protein AAG906_006574 [Vitis piasezkii]